MTDERGYRRERRPRWGLLALVAGLHVLALYGLVRGFAPDFAESVIDRATSLVTVTVTTTPPAEPAPEPSAEPIPAPTPQVDEGAAAEPAPEATPRVIIAPTAPIVLPRPSPAPIIASTGVADASGARDSGASSGAGGAGEGTGSGRSGIGPGGGRGGMLVTRPVKIAGDIDNAADYPVPEGGRDVRIGHSVTVVMVVTVEGRAEDCQVVEPSPDPVSDRITCELAEERFRFEPARNALGEAVPGTFGWRQSWFRK